MNGFVSSDPGPSLTVRHGPFPLAWWKLGIAPGLWVVAFFLNGFADVRLRIDCESSRCVIQSTNWRRPPTRVEGGRELIQGVDASDRRRNKDGSWRVHLRVRTSQGAPLALGDEPQAEADRIAAEINDFAAGKRSSFHHDSGDHWWLAPLSWLLALVGVGLALDALRKRQALGLRVAGRSVTVDELGLLRRRTQHTTLTAPARDVVVCWHQLSAGGARTAAVWGATLELEMADGSTAQLTTIPREGLMAHYDAAAALRTVLKAPTPGPLRALCPDPLLRVPILGGPIIAVFAMIWAGISCGSLVGMMLYIVVLLLVDPGPLQNMDERVMMAAGAGAVGLAALLVTIVRSREAERSRYRALVERV
jgi:hypothetical protein